MAMLNNQMEILRFSSITRRLFSGKQNIYESDESNGILVCWWLIPPGQFVSSPPNSRTSRPLTVRRIHWGELTHLRFWGEPLICNHVQSDFYRDIIFGNRFIACLFYWGLKWVVATRVGQLQVGL